MRFYGQRQINVTKFYPFDIDYDLNLIVHYVYSECC